MTTLFEAAIALRDLTDQTGWMTYAACRGDSPRMFFDWETMHGPRAALLLADARATCAECPVRRACLNYALDLLDTGHNYGVWGGTTPDERRAMQRARTRRTTT